METASLVGQVVVMLACIWAGSRKGGMALGFWGGVGLLVVCVGFGAAPAAPPVDVMLIILAVLCATASMEAAGGVDFLVRVAERIIRRYPSRVTVVAPLVAYAFTVAAGTGHILYPLLPVIHDTALRNGVRPERPMTVAVTGSLLGITASPVSAAMAALIVVLEPHGLGLLEILRIAVPATLAGMLAASAVMYRKGKELEDDPEFRRRVAEGLVEDIPARVRLERRARRERVTVTALLEREGRSAEEVPGPTGADDLAGRSGPAPADGAPADGAPAERAEDRTARTNGARPGSARVSAAIFLTAVLSIVLLGAFPELRPLDADGERVGVAVMIQMVMLAAAALITLVTRVSVAAVAASQIARAGVVALVGIFGIAWLGLTVIEDNNETIIAALEQAVSRYPWTFALGLVLGSILMFSQASTTRTLVPLGLALGLSAPALVGMWPAVNGAFVLPTTGTVLAAISFDRTGTTRIGRFVLNHSFLLPGLTAVAAAVVAGLALAALY